jgi:hypothetical protein
MSTWHCETWTLLFSCSSTHCSTQRLAHQNQDL